MPNDTTARDQREVTMVANTQTKVVQDLRRRTHGWRVGTGLPVSLPPGRYAVTDEHLDGDERFLVLDDAFRIRDPASGEA